MLPFLLVSPRWPRPRRPCRFPPPWSSPFPTPCVATRPPSPGHPCLRAGSHGRATALPRRRCSAGSPRSAKSGKGCDVLSAARAVSAKLCGRLRVASDLGQPSESRLSLVPWPQQPRSALVASFAGSVCLGFPVPLFLLPSLFTQLEGFSVFFCPSHQIITLLPWPLPGCSFRYPLNPLRLTKAVRF